MINFAHGDIFMVGAFVGFFLALFLKLPLIFLIPLTMLLTAMLGMLIERVAYRRLRNAQRMSLVITSLGVGIFLENFVRLVAGPQTRQIPAQMNTNPIEWFQHF